MHKCKIKYSIVYRHYGILLGPKRDEILAKRWYKTEVTWRYYVKSNNAILKKKILDDTIYLVSRVLKSYKKKEKQWLPRTGGRGMVEDYLMGMMFQLISWNLIKLYNTMNLPVTTELLLKKW